MIGVNGYCFKTLVESLKLTEAGWKLTKKEKYGKWTISLLMFILCGVSLGVIF